MSNGYSQSVPGPSLRPTADTGGAAAGDAFGNSKVLGTKPDVREQAVV
jgi:hypothetical protein